MYNHSLRHRIVTGSFTLPVMIVLTLLVWLVPDVTSPARWGGLLMTALTTYLLVELNNRNALLRIRSRMMSATYLLLVAICPMLHDWNLSMIPVTTFVLSYFMLFSSYQEPRPEGYIFHAFLFAGIGSFFFPPVLVLALGYYFSMVFQLRNFNGRTFMAGIFGLILPYWFYTAYAIWANRLDTAYDYLAVWFAPKIPDFTVLSIPEWATIAVLGSFALIASVHFFHTSYNDKIRTRMLFYIIVTQEALLALSLVVYPDLFKEQSGLFVVNSALLIGHYYALGKGRLFDFWFHLSFTLLVGLGVFNHLY